MVVTARSPEKGQAIVDSIDESLRPEVSFAVVEDVAEDGAFDHACTLHLWYTLHLCMPHHVNLQL